MPLTAITAETRRTNIDIRSHLAGIVRKRRPRAIHLQAVISGSCAYTRTILQISHVTGKDTERIVDSNSGGDGRLPDRPEFLGHRFVEDGANQIGQTLELFSVTVQ